MRQLFVYYRVSSLKEAAFHSLWPGYVQALQHLLAQHGLHWQLMEREERAAAGDRTVMEVFHGESGVPPEFAEALRQCAQVLEPALSGGRHEEVFVPCAWSALQSTSIAGSR